MDKDGTVGIAMSGKGSGANPLTALLDTDLDDLWGNRGLTEASSKGSKSKKAVAESAEESQADAEASFLSKNMCSVSQPTDSLELGLEYEGLVLAASIYENWNFTGL